MMKWWNNLKNTITDKRSNTLIYAFLVLLLMALVVALFAFQQVLRTYNSFSTNNTQAQLYWVERNFSVKRQQAERDIQELVEQYSVWQANANIFSRLSQPILRTNPDIREVVWLDAQKKEHAKLHQGASIGRLTALESEPDTQSIEGGQGKSVYVAVNDDGNSFIVCEQTLRDSAQNIRGYLRTSIDLSGMMQQGAFMEFQREYQLMLLNRNQVIYQGATVRYIDSEILNATIDSRFCGIVLKFWAQKHVQKIDTLLLSLFAVLGLVVLLLLANTLRFLYTNNQRKNAERQLKEQNDIRMALENSLAIGIRIHEPNGMVRYANEAFCQMVGYELKDFVAKPTHLVPYVPAEEIERINQFRDKAAVMANQMIPSPDDQSGRIARFKRKDGTYIDTLMRGVPLRDEQQQLVGWVTSVEDITEKLHTERTLNNALSLRQAIEASLPVGVRVHDEQGKTIYANPTLCAMMGYPMTQIVGLAIAEGPFIVPTEVEKIKAFVVYCKSNTDDILRNKNTQSRFISTRYQRQNGEIFDAILRAAPMVDETGSVSNWVTSIEDVSELRRLEDFKINETKRLESIHFLLSLGEMASSIAHELNQPLSAISSYATGLRNYMLVKEQDLDYERIIRIAEKLLGQAQRASNVARKVRQFVKHRELQIERVSVPKLLASSAELMELELQRHRCQLLIESYSEGHDVPDVLADTTMVQQTLINLLRNAIDAMVSAAAETRCITVRMQLRDERTLKITIMDTGPGIAADELEKIFEPFYSTKKNGVGIGLNICRSMIESMGGHLWASIEGHEGGGCLNISLPTMLPEGYT